MIKSKLRGMEKSGEVRVVFCCRKKKPTHSLCVWGYWWDPDTFILTTYYPGKPAPREPHDPKIASDELKKSMIFWSKHAIVVDRP